MLAVFSSIFIAAQPVMDLIDAGNKWLQDAVAGRDARRGAVFAGGEGLASAAWAACSIFLPQILILFLFIACWKIAATWPGPRI